MDDGGALALLSLIVGVIVLLTKALIPRSIKDTVVDSGMALAETLLSRINMEFMRILGDQTAHNVVILLGIGGSGKTTFIRTVIGDPNANPDAETMKFSIYKKRYTIESGVDDKGTKRIETSIIVADYRGQDFSTLVRGILDHTKRGKEFRAGNINTVLFLIDIFWPCDDVNKQEVMSDQPDLARLKRNIEYWNADRVQDIFHSFTDRGTLTNVIVFVNKCDLLASYKREELIGQWIQPLVTSITKHTSSLSIDPLVVYGSVKTGEGVVPVVGRILRSAVYA